MEVVKIAVCIELLAIAGGVLVGYLSFLIRCLLDDWQGDSPTKIEGSGK